MDRETRLVHAGRDPEGHHGIVNPPLYRASTILYPTLAAYDGRHERRYTSFASSLFGVLLHTGSEAAVAAMVDGLRLFKIGTSLGGFGSLILSARPERTARPWREPGFLLRLHVGFEAVEDLIADLEEGLSRLGAALQGGAGAAR